MLKKIKLGTGVLVGVSAVSICIAAALFIVKNQEQGKRLDVEETLAQTMAAKDEVEKELMETLEVKQAVELQLKSLGEEMAVLRTDLEKEKELQVSATTGLNARISELNQVKASLNAEKKEKTELTRKLAAAEGDYTRLEAELDKLALAKETLEQKLMKELGKSEVELEKIVVTPEEIASISAAAFQEGAVVGEVMVVNRDFNFIVANLGNKSSLETGQVLGIFRNSEFVAKVEIERVYTDMSTATILAEVQDIEQGDSVSVLKE